MNSRLRNLALDVETTLKKIASETTSFSESSSISCLKGCSACCRNSDNVWATPLELLPMAFEIFDRGLAEKYLDRITTEPNRCTAHEDHGGRYGRCMEYEHRPSICRLFGSSVRLKHSPQGGHVPEGLFCNWQREHFRNEIEQIENLPVDHKDLCVARHLSNQFNISFSKNLEVEMPINQSLQKALEMIMQDEHYIEMQMQAQQPASEVHQSTNI